MDEKKHGREKRMKKETGMIPTMYSEHDHMSWFAEESILCRPSQHQPAPVALLRLALVTQRYVPPSTYLFSTYQLLSNTFAHTWAT